MNLNKILDKLFGHKCGRYTQDIIWEESVVTGVPLVVGYKCPICGKEVKNTPAYYQNEGNKRLAPEGFHWVYVEKYGGWTLVSDKLDTIKFGESK